MGLEVLDIVIRTEDAFGVTIPDKDASELLTVGSLYDYVIARMRDRDAKKCLSILMFYRLRSVITGLFNIPRNQVTRDAAVETLIPSVNRQQLWRNLKEQMALDVPPLERTYMLSTILGIMTVVILFSGMFINIGVGIAAAAIFLFIALQVTNRFATSVPKSCSTIDGFVRKITAINFAKLSEQERGWSDDDVWNTIKYIVVDSLVIISPDDVTKDARFVDDLGAG